MTFLNSLSNCFSFKNCSCSCNCCSCSCCSNTTSVQTYTQSPARLGPVKQSMENLDFNLNNDTLPEIDMGSSNKYLKTVTVSKVAQKQIQKDEVEQKEDSPESSTSRLENEVFEPQTKSARSITISTDQVNISIVLDTSPNSSPSSSPTIFQMIQQSTVIPINAPKSKEIE